MRPVPIPRAVCLVFTVLLAITVSPARSAAQEKDPIASRLADARTAYESKMEAVRTRITTALDAKEKELRSAKKPILVAIQDLEAARHAFNESGTWPDLKIT